MFMGDRWSYPHQASAATYVWMPLRVENTKISIPEYWQAWDINKLKPVNPLNGSLQIEKSRFMLIATGILQKIKWSQM